MGIIVKSFSLLFITDLCSQVHRNPDESEINSTLRELWDIKTGE